MTVQTSRQIVPARDAADIADAARLFSDYAAGLGFDLGYQGFADELATLPGKYTPPLGALLLARLPDGVAAGCVALRPLDPPATCEMKRLYVAPEGRGMGIGAALVSAVLDAARAAGYGEIRLDTNPAMASAVALYRRFGFRPIAPYCASPFVDAIFLRLKLGAPDGS
jgi:ribosomal protein S18 acetylase RimI-like enzyme